MKYRIYLYKINRNIKHVYMQVIYVIWLSKLSY